MHGIDVSEHPQYNLDNWLNPESTAYKPELAGAVFDYQARVEKDGRLRICIQTAEMKDAAWKYAHQGQLILDGTFAPTGNKATHAGYDTTILVEVLTAWKNSLGSQNGVPFTPCVAITDTDTKERGALAHTWPDIWLILCKFHVRQCWTNQRKKMLHMGKTSNFPKQQVKGRLQALEKLLILSVDHEAAQQLITEEQAALSNLAQLPEMAAGAMAGLVSRLDYRR
ncbi:hypothetical protein JB92DRAFT_3127297 [Gautieria morchelliformis]|nr:hypothetical protein JB92DRAFT_3127297 [Gautieria morchelliformis]